MKGKTAAVIPFYNEASTLGKLIKEVLRYVDFVIAVNDGSDDNWQSEVEESERLIIITHSENRGKGAALRSGFLKVLETDAEKIVTLDADYQHDPKFIPSLLEKLDECEIVIGNRLKNISSMPFARKLSNFLTSRLLSFKTGVRIEDSQCGFRAFRRKCIQPLLPKENGFEAESMMIVNAARNNFSICFVDVPTIYGNDNSKMRNLQAIVGFIKGLFK